ncbi:MAG TPA: putative inorganic carbon transporter subunit DabA [Actinomycetota bacterium]|nr:putative inorganic carbon transporter subunit DabA [Actinomycetota bacterium]
MTHHDASNGEHLGPGEQLVEVVEHLGHLLPSQGPITTFVHHNTLHGLQHLPFDEAAVAAEAFYGASAYPPVTVSRAQYRSGRITDADLDAVTADGSEEGRVIGMVGSTSVLAEDIRRLHLLHGINAIDPAELRFLMTERGADRRFMDDIPPPARERAIERAVAEVRDGIDRVGRDVTVGEWLGRLLGVDIASKVKLTAAGEVSAGAAPRKDADASLRELGIPEARRSGYLSLVDAAMAEVRGEDRQHLREVWLAAEARVVDRLARRHLGLPGNVDAMERAMLVDPEAAAVRSLWVACLDACGLTDPFSPTDPHTLDARDPDASIDRLGEVFTTMQTGGGAEIPLDPTERDEVAEIVERVLDELRTRVERDPWQGQDPLVREAASAAWFAHPGSDGEPYTRIALDALEELASLMPDAAVEAAARRIALKDPARALKTEAEALLEADLSRLGRDLTHAELLARLTGVDTTALVNRYMIRVCAGFLDQGQAAWRMPDRALGFYGAWRASVEHDATLAVSGLRGWRPSAADLPEDPVEALMVQLDRLGVDPDHHHAYLGAVLAKLPGWAAMMNWLGTNPEYPTQKTRPTDLIQYLAVRLTIEAEVVGETLQRTLGVKNAHVAALADRLRAAPAEFYVRTQLHRGRLPTIVAQAARDLERRGGHEDEWSNIALQAWSWSRQPDERARMRAADEAWRLFRLAQVAGWSAEEIRTMPAATRDRILATLDDFPEPDHRKVWMAAYEGHYREEILGALASNQGKGRWQVRDRRPKAQIVFCIDEREESMHRAVDELDADYETFGAGGFFNMAMAYSGFDDHDVTPLCPAGVIPTNRVKEVPREDEESVALAAARRERRLWRETAENTYWELKRNAVSGLFLTQLVGLFQAIPLTARVLAPWNWVELKERVEARLIPAPATQLTVDAERFGELGFTLTEQTDRIETQLRNIGMTHTFARLVVFMGHGSSSVNNPHESAHDCGACGGKHGAPNARAFAAIANRAEVRAELAGRGIEIPDDTRFVGGIHNTASDRNTFFDTQDIPESHRAEWDAVRADLDEARALSARERCTRFYSAPKTASLERSVRHVEERSRDLSQVRPEWGHCTNAVAVVGRRALTQGLFLDRRTFVISYNPNGDDEGSIVQRILLALGPVGAGINLEYYFSTVDNRVFGCDTKVPHNVTGLLGVMEGAASDLRTGLPKQMIEIHEPMRLLLIVEASVAVLGQIYGNQPAIAELLDNEWIHLVSIDPGDGHFELFVPGQGFVTWDGEPSELVDVASSFDYYKGRTGFLPPVRIVPEAAG